MSITFDFPAGPFSPRLGGGAPAPTPPAASPAAKASNPAADVLRAFGEKTAEDDESSAAEAVGSAGRTKYERERQANIQRNKELMMQLSINKMADKVKPEETEPKKRGPKGGWKKKRAAMKPSRGSSRIQRLQEERKHTAWKDLHVEKSLKTHPNCFVDLTVQCLGMADASRTFGESRGGDEEDQMVVTWSTAKSTDADVRYSPSDPESSTPYGPVVMGSIMIATMSVFIGVTAANFQSIA